ncbi:MAG: phenylalanine--tRNA ligase subunit beta [Acidimicrobiia bacterium]
MRVPLNWLADYVDLPVTDPIALARILDDLGHEVDGVEVLERTFEGVVVGRVETVDAHPDADRIRLTTVDTGDGPTEVVCGAWNFEAGAIVPVARPGATLDRGSFEITERAIRGVTSHGMICSAAELGLGDDAEGILVLDDAFEVGRDFADYVALPDAIIDLAITPNRPDAMAMIGIARELAAHFGVEWRLPPVTERDGAGPSDLGIRVEDPRCPRFTGREVRGVRMGPSPLWMQLRLARAGQRPISNVVDVSNYVMLELGQPTHAFDLEQVAEDTIVVRAATAGETLTTLDGVTRELDSDDLVVADPERALSLAGTMGGEASEVSDGTSRVLVEVASWDAPTILHMSHRHGLRSEASSRFERGVDPEMPPLANHRMVDLLVDLAGGTPMGDLVDAHPRPHEPVTVDLPLSLVERTLGVAMPAAEVTGFLEPLGIVVEARDEALSVTAPSWRPDLTRAIDHVEEIARLRGYASFEPSIPAGPGGGLSATQARERLLRDVLTGLGLSEALTFSFHGPRALADLGLGPDDPRRNAIEVRNPLREEERLLRTTLLPGLLDAARFNVNHGLSDVALFEIGRVFSADDSREYGTIPDQPTHLGLVLVGSLGAGGVDGPRRAVDAHSGIGIIRPLVAALGHGELGIESFDHRPLHPGRGAVVRLPDGTELGTVGELHPRVARAWDLPGRVVVAELALEPLVAPPALWQFDEPSLLPHVDFDLAFVLPDAITTAAVLAAARDASGDLLEGLEPFDTYRGTGVPDGHRSLAIRLRLRPDDRTLTNEEAGAVRQAVIDAVAGLGGTLRGVA